MTSRAASSMIRSLGARAYATQAAVKVRSDSGLTKVAPQVAKIQENGLQLVSCDDNGALSSFAVVVRAGASSELSTEIGLSHFTSFAAVSNTEHMKRISLIRGCERAGSSLRVTNTRDYTIYSVDCQRTEADIALTILREITTPRQISLFGQDWNNSTHMETASYKYQGDIQVMEGLHKAAYVRGLGRSLYCPETNNFNNKHVENFMHRLYTPDNMVLVGINVNHGIVENVGYEYNFPEVKSTAPVKSKYFGGGQVRVDTLDDVTHVAVAAEGSSLSGKDLAAGAVFQHLLGVGPRVKYSNNDATRLGKAVSGASKNPFSVSAFHLNYIDSGLFGFHAAGSPGDMAGIIASSLGEVAKFTKEGVKNEELERAKKQTKSSIAMNMESGSSFAEALGVQVLSGVGIQDMGKMMSAVDAVTAADVTSFAKKVANGKLTMSAFGDLCNTPALSELS